MPFKNAARIGGQLNLDLLARFDEPLVALRQIQFHAQISDVEHRRQCVADIERGAQLNLTLDDRPRMRGQQTALAVGDIDPELLLTGFGSGD